MEINDSGRLKHQRLQKTAASEYEASLIKAQHIKSSSHEQTATNSVNKDNIIKGEIIDLRYQEVKIRLEPSGQVISARVSGDVPLTIGQTASFIVSDKTGDQITLKFLSSSNAPVNDLVYKALYSSGLGASERNIAIVQELLKYNMPVDKNTILSLIKLTSTYPDTNLTTLTLMHKNNLLINANSIVQFEVYQEGTHHILTGLNSLISRISDAVIAAANKSHNIQESDFIIPNDNFKSKDVLFISDIIYNSEVMNHEQNCNIPYNITADTEQNSSSSSADIEGYEALINNTDNTANIANIEDSYMIDDFLGLNKEILSILRGGKSQILELSPETEIKYIFTEKELMQLQDGLNLKSLSDSITLKDLFILVNDIYESGYDFSFITNNNTLTADLFEAFVSVEGFMTTPGKEKLVSLLNTDTYHNLISEALHNRWTLSPKDLTDRDNVTEYYSRLQDDLDKLQEVSTSSKHLDFENMKSSINKLQDNLQFMRDLNELFLYVQLPMRLTKQDAHGDLYVFTRKKQSSDITDQISVLLHLEMENLGPMDIHMTMKIRNIQAVFYLEKEIEHIISDHLYELIEVLSKKGYSLQAKTQVSESKPDFITDILEQDEKNYSIYRHSFDIRA